MNLSTARASTQYTLPDRAMLVRGRREGRIRGNILSLYTREREGREKDKEMNTCQGNR